MFPPPVLTRSGSKGLYQNGYDLNQLTWCPYYSFLFNWLYSIIAKFEKYKRIINNLKRKIKRTGKKVLTFHGKD
jgi:hypothetical protein